MQPRCSGNIGYCV